MTAYEPTGDEPAGNVTLNREALRRAIVYAFGWCTPKYMVRADSPAWRWADEIIAKIEAVTRAE
jgi:hypothetical protein